MKNVLVLLTLLASLPAVFAANQVVTTTANSGAGSLRQAITDVGAGETITFDAALDGATIPLGSALVISAKSMTIDASTLSQGITLDGGGTTRVFTISGACTVMMDSLTITGGSSPGSQGGGLSVINPAVVTMDHCSVTGNTSGVSGGGLYLRGTLTMKNSTLSANSAPNIGGIDNTSGSLTLINSTLSGNTTAGFGGALAQFGSGTTTLRNSTVSGNSAGSLCGGLYRGAGTLSIENSIVAGNTGSSSPDIYSSSTTRNGVNFIGNNAGASGFAAGNPNANGDFVGTSVSPLDPQLAPLGTYGGRTQTMPPLTGSPAIDTALATAHLLSTDQRGFPRVIDGDRSGVATVDIGAVENLTGADLSNANLTSTDLSGVDLTGTDLTGADLSGANLSNTGVSPAQLATAASTAGVILGAVDYSGADLSGINLATADLTGANLTNAFSVVNTATDEADVPASGGTGISLREALRDAPAGIEVRFYAAVDSSTITLTSGELTLTRNVDIDASSLSGGLTISGNNASRILWIENNATVALTALTLTEGRVVDSPGGAIYISAGCGLSISNCTIASCKSIGTNGADGIENAAAPLGNGSDGNSAEAGGIYNAGTLTIIESSLTANQAIPGVGGVGYGATGLGGSGGTADGGAIYNTGTLTIRRSTFASNTANGAYGSKSFEYYGGAGGHGGAGAIRNKGILSLYSSTFTMNTGNGAEPGYGGGDYVYDGIGGDGGAGAIFNTQTILLISQCTFHGNSALYGYKLLGGPFGVGSYGRSGAGNIANVGGSLTLKGSIITGGSSPYTSGPYAATDLSGSVNSLGYNILGEQFGSTGLTDGINGDLIGVDPLLGSLADNGGPTLTMAIPVNSPALNASDDSMAESFDQRGIGFARLSGPHLDIGAFELQLSPPSIIAQSAGSVTLDPDTFFGSLTFDSTIHPNNFATMSWIEFGLGTNYGFITSAASLGSGGNDVLTSFPVSQLSPGLEWHYRVVASNLGGTTYGDDQTVVIGTLGGGTSGVAGDLDGNGTFDSAEFDVIRANLVDELASQNAAGYYSTSQVQALNVDAPLLTQDPSSGLFTLTIAVRKSINLIDFTPLPMSAANTDFNLEDELEFEFSSPDDAAFFRIESK